LIERRVDEVRELDLGDRQEPVERHPDRDPDDAGLGQRRIDHALLSALGHEPLGDLEHAAAGADVLTDQHDAVVGRHLVVEGVPDRGDEVLLRHASPSAKTLRVEVDGSGSGASQAAVIAASTWDFTSSWMAWMVSRSVMPASM